MHACQAIRHSLSFIVSNYFIKDISNSFQDGTIKAEIISNDIMPVINKAAAAAISEQNESPITVARAPPITSKIDNTSPVVEFLEGKNCLIGVRISSWPIYPFV